MSAARVCATCGYVHASNDARAVGRFTGEPRFVAADAGTPSRATRAEAEADQCTWRASRPASPPAAPSHRSSPPSSPVAVPSSEPQPFPASLIETAARAKAWCEFLTQVRLSLLVWEIDVEVRTGCESATEWVARCLDDLAVFTRNRPTTLAQGVLDFGAVS